MPILPGCSRQSALAAVPFGMPATPFWMYACAAVVFLSGVVVIFRELPQQHGIDKIMPFGRLFFAIPLAVFGSEHFTITTAIASLVPRWIPAHTFWVYLVGAGFVGAGLAMAARVQPRLAAALVGMTMFSFVLLMDLPGVAKDPGNRFIWALAARELAFSGGALAFALAGSTRAWAGFPRFFVGLPALFYGVEHLLHPAYVPGVPLRLLTPAWIHGGPS